MMRKRTLVLIGFLLCVGLILSGAEVAEDQGKPIATNKDKLLTLAVQGQIAPAEPGRSYATTWEGKPKMAIGIGGINYNLKIGDKTFGWAAGDRATVGVATVGKGEDRFSSAWLHLTSIGNEVRILSGDAKGKKGVVIGKFERYVLVHFDDAIMKKLAIDSTIQAKACGVGLEIEGFADVFIHGIDPNTLEKMYPVMEVMIPIMMSKFLPIIMADMNIERMSKFSEKVLPRMMDDDNLRKIMPEMMTNVMPHCLESMLPHVSEKGKGEFIMSMKEKLEQS